MSILRTDDSRFSNLSGYPYQPNYLDVDKDPDTQMRIHYLDEGPSDGEVVLCMHGQPSWSYLYRKMIPFLTAAGFRVIAPDLIGFGRSDKLSQVDDYTYAGHVDWMSQWFTKLGLTNVNLVCQDWGGLIGLRLAANFPEHFARLVVANTALPDSQTVSPEMSAMLGQIYPSIPVPSAAEVIEQFAGGAPGAFLYWVKYAAESPDFSIRDVFDLLSNIEDEKVLEGYVAPFPDQSYVAGARAFPSLVPLLPQHQSAREDNDAAWKVLETFDKPVLTAFSDGDAVSRGGEAVFQRRIPGAKGVDHVTIKGGGHFLQEDQPEALSQAIIDFVNKTK